MLTSHQTEWEQVNWRGRVAIVRRCWSEASIGARALWLYSLGSGFLLPLGFAIAILLDSSTLAVAFAVAFAAVVLSLVARGAVMIFSRRPR